MMKRFFIFFLGLIVMTSCKETKKGDTAKSKTKVIAQVENDPQKIVQHILDLQKLQDFFHPEIKKRLPLKLVKNEFVNDSLTIFKFDKKVRIATLESFQKEKIEDYLILEKLQIKNDTASFELRYKIEGVVAQGKFVKRSEKWIIEDVSVVETNPTSAVEKAIKNPLKTNLLTLVYKGADLSYLSKTYYNHGRYKQVLMAYNNFTDKRSVDKKHDSIKIPKLAFLANDPSLPKLHSISTALDNIIKARNLYLKQGRSLWELPKDSHIYRSVPPLEKQELLGASKLMFEAISQLKKVENSPIKAIGQFRQVAEYLEDITNGKIDENGYILDLVHQRFAYGYGNIIKWAKE